MACWKFFLTRCFRFLGSYRFNSFKINLLNKHKIMTENSSRKQVKTMQEIARENFSLWNDALQTKDPKEVAKLYSKDNTLLPTVSGEFKKGQAGAEEYFKHFLEKNPTGEVVEDEVQALGTGCYLHSGMYNFEVGPDDNRQVVEARFTFAWEQND